MWLFFKILFTLKYIKIIFFKKIFLISRHQNNSKKIKKIKFKEIWNYVTNWNFVNNASAHNQIPVEIQRLLERGFRFILMFLKAICNL
jgi:hypothetical protein